MASVVITKIRGATARCDSCDPRPAVRPAIVALQLTYTLSLRFSLSGGEVWVKVQRHTTCTCHMPHAHACTPSSFVNPPRQTPGTRLTTAQTKRRTKGAKRKPVRLGSSKHSPTLPQTLKVTPAPPMPAFTVASLMPKAFVVASGRCVVVRVVRHARAGDASDVQIAISSRHPEALAIRMSNAAS